MRAMRSLHPLAGIAAVVLLLASYGSPRTTNRNAASRLPASLGATTIAVAATTPPSPLPAVLATVAPGPTSPAPLVTASPARMKDWQTASNPVYGLAFSYPHPWQQNRAYGDSRFDGADGFVQLSAMGGAATLDDACREEARPGQQGYYGSQPTITPVRVQGQDACLILPSADQPAAWGDRAALLVAPPQPITLPIGTPPVPTSQAAYAPLVVWADRGHLGDIAGTIQFVFPMAREATVWAMVARVTAGTLTPLLQPGASLAGMETVRLVDVGPGSFQVLYTGGGKTVRVTVGQDDLPTPPLPSGSAVAVGGQRAKLVTFPDGHCVVAWDAPGRWQPGPGGDHATRDRVTYTVVGDGLSPEALVAIVQGFIPVR